MRKSPEETTDELRFDPPLPLPLDETAGRLFDLLCALHAALSQIAKAAPGPGGVGQIARDALRVCK